jgi:hypothetical protein
MILRNQEALMAGKQKTRKKEPAEVRDQGSEWEPSGRTSSNRIKNIKNMYDGYYADLEGESEDVEQVDDFGPKGEHHYISPEEPAEGRRDIY